MVKAARRNFEDFAQAFDGKLRIKVVLDEPKTTSRLPYFNALAVHDALAEPQPAPGNYPSEVLVWPHRECVTKF